jgi:hypothetical protein
MAVRLFDLTDSHASDVTLLEAAPRRRRDLRRARHRWAVIGVVSVLAPFVAALVVLGVSH